MFYIVRENIFVQTFGLRLAGGALDFGGSVESSLWSQNWRDMFLNISF